MRSQGTKCIGFLKVGDKQLFIRGRGGEMIEMKPLAVLDFFVDPSVQRGGHGKKLFDIMLAYMRTEPAKIAFDRPSDKLIAFLGKHFRLTSYVPQNNNYVVFDDYFKTIGNGNRNQNSVMSPVRNIESISEHNSTVFGHDSFQRRGVDNQHRIT